MESDLDENSLRMALDRLGGEFEGRSNQGRKASQSHVETRRRRFVQDGQVLVEHQTTTRNSARVAAVHFDNEHNLETQRLRQALKLEQRRTEVFAREIAESQLHSRTLETHLEHSKLRIKDLEKQLDDRATALKLKEQYIVQLLEKLSLLQNSKRSELSKCAKPARRVTQKKQVVEKEQEPVRWWKD